MKSSSKLLTLLCGFAAVAVISLIPSDAFAQSQSHGLYHHSQHGALGAAGHYTYGDHFANQHMHSGVQYGTPQYTPMYSTPQYSTPMYSQGSGSAMTSVPQIMPSVQMMPSTPQVMNSGVVSQGSGTSGSSSRTLYPGMVMPDGSVVVSVGQ